MLAPYRDILSIPGAAAFTLWGIIARLQMGLTGLGLFLMVQIEYDSYATAGIAVAIQSLSWALISPAIGKLVDARGQFAVLRFGLAVSVTARTGLIVAAVTHQPLWVLAAIIPFQAAAGTQSTFGRARWAHAVRDRNRLNTAFSMESSLEEIVFIAGPPVATLLATQVASWAASGLAAAAVLVGGYMFIAQRSTEPPASRVRAIPVGVEEDAAAAPSGAGIAVAGSIPALVRWRPRRPSSRPLLLAAPSLLLLILMFAASGAMFVAIDASTVAFAEGTGQKALAGVALALFAAGSLVGGLVYGARSWTMTLASRLVWGFSFTAAGVAAALFSPTLWVLAALLFLTGLAIAPTMAVGDGAAHAAVGRKRVTEAMTWTRTGIDLGIAGGAWATGALIDHHGYHAGFILAASMGGAAALVALASWRYIRSLPYAEDVD